VDEKLVRLRKRIWS